MVGKRILLANDPELLSELKNSLFGRSGFVLLVADGEQQAFELIEDQDPALAIFNLEQPGFMGDECCRRVKSDPILRETPIILLHSGLSKESERCMEVGCDAILTRPIDPNALMNAACRLLNIDKRGVPRTDVRLDLRWGKDGHNHRPDRILNLNLSGAFIGSSRLHPVETLVNLEIFLAGSGPPLCCRGRVAWVNHPEWVKTTKLPTGMGVQFVDLAPEDAETLRNFLNQLPQGKG